MLRRHRQPLGDSLRVTRLQGRPRRPESARRLGPGVGLVGAGDDAEIGLGLGEALQPPVRQSGGPGRLRGAGSGALGGGDRPGEGLVVETVEEVRESQRAAQPVGVGGGKQAGKPRVGQQALGGQGGTAAQGAAEFAGQIVGGVGVGSLEVGQRQAAQPQFAAVDAARAAQGPRLVGGRQGGASQARLGQRVHRRGVGVVRVILQPLPDVGARGVAAPGVQMALRHDRADQDVVFQKGDRRVGGGPVAFSLQGEDAAVEFGVGVRQAAVEGGAGGCAGRDGEAGGRVGSPRRAPGQGADQSEHPGQHSPTPTRAHHAVLPIDVPLGCGHGCAVLTARSRLARGGGGGKPSVTPVTLRRREEAVRGVPGFPANRARQKPFYRGNGAGRRGGKSRERESPGPPPDVPGYATCRESG